MSSVRVRRAFGRHAAEYDRHAAVQRRLADELDAALTGTRPRQILELGCGTGYLTRRLRARFPRAELTAIDLSARMLERARAACPGPVRWLLGDAEAVAWEPARYDLIVSSATVQWFARPAATTAALAAALTPGGCAAHATFGPSTFWELWQAFAEAELARGAVGSGPRGPHLPGASELETALRARGLEVEARTRVLHVGYPDCRAFLAAVKATGAAQPRRAAEPGLLRDAMRRYDRSYRFGAGVRASYELVQVVGRSAAAGSAQGTEAVAATTSS